MVETNGREGDAAGGSVEAEPVELAALDDSGGGKTAQQASAGGDENLKMILDIPVDIRVELGHTVLSIGEILRLGQGSIVTLDRLTGSPVDLVVNGKLVGQGDVVVVEESFGIRITKLLKPEDRIAAL